MQNQTGDSNQADHRARLIAFYLPQFHPIPENDEWWGKGFTEWTNVAKARPLFPGHYQPRVPADLGFYDLRVPETRAAQAEMARSHGIEGFCYWHYWFAGDRLLERPFDEVLQTKEPDFPFCLAWANESWTGIWHGLDKRILKEQTYPGMEDHRRHFEYLSKAFADPRYIRVEEKPVFLLYKPHLLPDAERVTDYWRQLASEAGFKGLHLIGITLDPHWDPRKYGFDAVTVSNAQPQFWLDWNRPLQKTWRKIRFNSALTPLLHRFSPRPQHVYSYKEAVRQIALKAAGDWESFPCIVPNWDNTPRSGNRGYVLHGSTPQLFKDHLRRALTEVQGRAPDRRMIFVKSWNEWAEGNHLEPDLKWGMAYLKVVAEELSR